MPKQVTAHGFSTFSEINWEKKNKNPIEFEICMVYNHVFCHHSFNKNLTGDIYFRVLQNNLLNALDDN